MTITITVPWEPTSAISPNSRLSTRAKRAHHEQARDIAMLAARQVAPYVLGTPDMPALDITWVRSKTRNRMDLDNLIACCKGVIDGVTRELGFDDRRIVALTAAQRRDATQPGCIIVTIREATLEERRRTA